MYTVAKKVDDNWTVVSPPFSTLQWAVTTAINCQSDFDMLNKKCDLSRKTQYGVFENGNLVLVTTPLKN